MTRLLSVMMITIAAVLACAGVAAAMLPVPYFSQCDSRWSGDQLGGDGPEGVVIEFADQSAPLGVAGSGSTYDPQAAVSYSDTWWDGRNPNYHDYSSSGGDCANFVSQCLIAGGLDLSGHHGADSWGCIPYCDNLHDYLVNYLGATWETRLIDQAEPSWFVSGDPAIFGKSYDHLSHAVFAVTGDATHSATCNAHTSDQYHRTIQWFFDNDIFDRCTYYHISIITPLSGDLNGDDDGTRIDSYGIFDPSTAGFTFNGKTVHFGTSTDLPVMGDWDHDGKDEMGVYRPDNGAGKSEFHLVWQDWDFFPDGANVDVAYRKIIQLKDIYPNNIPIAGDWDGDEDDDVGGFCDNKFYLYTLNWGSGEPTPYAGDPALGDPGDKPIIGDWDGDEDDDIGVFRPGASTNYFYLDLGLTGVYHELGPYPLGNVGDEPLIGDWDGDGDDDIGVYRPVDGTFHPNYPPTLSSGSVNPSSGDTSTTFNYYVTYTDSDGDAPTTKYVYIDGSAHTMTKISGDYTSGATFKYSTTLSAGSHNYYFYFDDGHGHTKRLPTSGTSSGPTVSTPNQPPTLSSGSVDPSSGDTSTTFDYYVTYTDSDGDAPTTKYVYVDGFPHMMTKISGDYTSGAMFKYSTTLSAGSHNYYFYFDDGHGHAKRLPTSGTYSGPSVNTPPYTPSNPSPSNHATGQSINADLSWTGGDPDTGDTVKYDVFFGTITSPPLGSNDQSGTTYDPGTLSYNTKYYWKITATDNHGASTSGSLWDFTTGSAPNNPPSTPSTPSGQGFGNTGTSYSYSTSATDPDGDQVKYTFDWNDGTTSETGLVNSGTSATRSHSWGSAGTYYVRAKATDSEGVPSGWSASKSVAITCTPPPSPTLNDPGTTDTDGDYTVSWSGVSGATSYTLEEDTSSSFSSPTEVYSGYSTSKDITGRSDGTYYYRVKACNACGCSGWSNIGNIEVCGNLRFEGDVNSNSAITGADAQMVAQHIVGTIVLTGEDAQAADADDNHPTDPGVTPVITGADLQLIVQHVVGTITEFPGGLYVP